MRLEHLPIVIGVIAAAIGILLIADAWLSDEMLLSGERRRSPRAERHRGGEAIVGAGALCMAAAFIGRDDWRYGTLAMLFGAILLAIGIALNRRFLGELLLNRGAARRAPGGSPPQRRQSGGAPSGDKDKHKPPPPPPDRMRLR